jgi:hypothetical protein
MTNNINTFIILLICTALLSKSAAQEIDTAKNQAKKRFYFYPIDHKAQMEQKQLNLMPNPAKDFVEIKIDKPHQAPFKLELFDLKGTRILLQEWKGEIIDLNHFSSGLYILKLSRDRESYTGKLLIKK